VTKAVKFVFYPSKLKEQPFFANNIKICPLPTPMVALGQNLNGAIAVC